MARNRYGSSFILQGYVCVLILYACRLVVIMRNRYFTDNNDSQARHDHARKIRSIVDALQMKFRKGFVVPSRLSFDEGMLPSQSP